MDYTFCDKELFDEIINLIKQQGKSFKNPSNIQYHSTRISYSGDEKHLLHVAARFNFIEVIECLIATGCDITARDASRMTPLMIAVVNKNFEAARILHEAQVKLLNAPIVLPADENGFLEEPWRDKLELPLYNDLVSEMRRRGLSSERIGETLAKVTKCTPSDVYYFRDPDMIKAYLQSATGLSTSKIVHCCGTGIDRYDLQHTLLMLDNAPINRDSLFGWCCRYVVSDIDVFRKNKSGRKFLEKFFSLEVFSEEKLKHLEKQFTTERISDVKIFDDLHSIVKDKYGRDIYASLWGNAYVSTYSSVTSLLRDDQIDLDGRGYNGKTPLHYAAKNGCTYKNLKLLLERGADPNVLDKKQRTPLGLAVFSEWSRESEMCVELLFLAGANPLFIGSNHVNNILLFPEYLPPFVHHKSIIKLVFPQLIIYETLGQSIEKSVDLFEQWYNYEELEKFMEECREQLKDLKRKKIRETGQFSMFTILAERPEKMFRFLSKEDARTVLKFAECNEETLIPYYRELLKKRGEDFVKINRLMQRAIAVVCQFTGISDPNHFVVNKIVNYFSVKDLQKFSIVDVRQEKSSLKTDVRKWLKRAKQRVCQIL